MKKDMQKAYGLVKSGAEVKRRQEGQINDLGRPGITNR
jgi:hypothetical protein